MRDQATGRDLLLYRSVLPSDQVVRQLDRATAIVQTWSSSHPGDADSINLFSSPGSLWLAVADAGSAASLLEQLRSASVFPAPPTKAPPAPPPPAPAPSAPPKAAVSPRRQSSTPAPARPSAPSSKRRSGLRRGLLLLVAALGGLLGLVAYKLLWNQPEPPRQAPIVTPTAKPQAQFKADPKYVPKGGEVVLSWQTQDASSVEIEPGVGPVDSSGSRSVTVDANTRYALTATNSGGSVKKFVSIKAIPNTPVTPGSTVRLEWNTSNASSVSIDQGIGAVSLSGVAEATPAASTTFTLTATGPGGGSDSRQVHVTVASAAIRKPTITATVNGQPAPVTLAQGDTARFCWNTTDADQVVVGNQSFSPNSCFPHRFDQPGEFSYIFVAKGKGGLTSAQLDFSVRSKAAPASASSGASGDVFWTGTPAPGGNVTITWMLNGFQWQLVSGAFPATVQFGGKNPAFYAGRIRTENLTVPGREAVVTGTTYLPGKTPVTYSIQLRCRQPGPQTVHLHWTAESP